MTTIVTRAGKGSPLTNTEMDTNLTNLNSYKVEQDISGNATITGDVYLTGSGKRITGDFSNATIANRVMFQTSTVNGTTGVAAMPNGTGTAAAINAHNSSDPNNSSIAQLRATASTIELISTNVGTGTYLPMTFWTYGTEKLRIGADAGGTYTFGGTSPRIMGDFSTATVANRAIFQTSTVNGVTSLLAAPNGTATQSAVAVVNASDPTNASLLSMTATSTETSVRAGIFGTGTYLPLTFYAGGSERLRIDASGNVNVMSPAGLGYGTGAGGTVTQATSKSTAVTLNKPTGQITMNNAALAANSAVQFLLFNSLIGANDIVVITPQASSIDMSFYDWRVATNGNGSAAIYVRNISGVSKSDALVFNFAIIKGSAA